MSTPHISAEKGDFAKTVLMPGDPLRAKFIADTFLKDVRQVTGVRGMLGFTGTYEGRPISVMGSGMGMPSIGIYSYELFKFYDVENIIRIGSAGSYTDKAKLFDVVLAAGAVSESNYARVQSGFDAAQPEPERQAARFCRKAGHPPHRGKHPLFGCVLPSALRCKAHLLGKAARRARLPVRGDGELCSVRQRRGAGQERCLPADHLRQLCLPGDHHRRAAPEELHRYDEGRTGRGVLI